MHICAHKTHIYAYFEEKMHICAYLVLHICAYFMHIYAHGILHICAYFGFAYFLHIYAYYAHILHISYLLICVYSCIFGTAYCCIFRAYFCIFKSAYYGIFTLMHIQAYNTYTCIFNACLCIFWAYYAHILNIFSFAYFKLLANIQAVSMQLEHCFFCQLILPIKVVASDVGQWKVPLHKARDPGFFMPLVLHVFAKSFFRLWKFGA